jgi:hypothetical protein
MTEWNKQRLTKKQKEAATLLFDKWRKQGVGQQPYAVIDSKGNVKYTDKGAVCLGGLYSPYKAGKGGEGLVLFQMIITSELDCCRGSVQERLSCTDEEIVNYVDNAVRNPLLRPWICKHTKAERLKFGIPIALEDVPTNAPLLISTWVRFMWDRHNNSWNVNIPIVKALKPKWKWAKVVVAAHCLSNLTKGEFYLQVPSTGHGLFGKASLLAIQDIVDGCFEFPEAKVFNFDTPSRGLGIEDMMRKYKVDVKDTAFEEALSGKTRAIPHSKSYGGRLFHKRYLPQILNVINRTIEEG